MKKNIFILFFAIMIIIGINCVYAADTNYSCDINIEGSKNTLKQGETETFEIKVSNINAEDGIILFNAEIVYDKDAFEYKFESGDEWNLNGIVENIVTVSRKDLLPNSQNQVVGKIILKAKSDAKDGNYSIGLKKIKFTMEGDKSFQVEDKSKKIEIKKDSSAEKEEEEKDKESKEEKDKEKEEEKESEKKEEKKEEKQSEEDKEKKEEKQSKEENNSESKENNTKKEIVNNNEIKQLSKTDIEEKNSSLPYTGVSEWIGISLIIILIVVTIVSYKMYKKWQKV